jgi:hypothetical protein
MARWLCVCMYVCMYICISTYANWRLFVGRLLCACMYVLVLILTGVRVWQVALCSGDMGFGASKTYDLEVSSY